MHGVVATPHTLILCPHAVTTLTEKPLLITFKKATVERTVTLTRMPSWLELCERVEEVFTELQAEAFSLLVDKLELSAPLWPSSVEKKETAKQTTMTLQVRTGGLLVWQAAICTLGMTAIM